jgi:hypothetical protein
MAATATSVNKYIENLPEDRRATIASLRQLILKYLPKGYKEGIHYGMICYYIPLSKYPKTYNGMPLSYISLASQKNYISIYLMGVYGEGEADFRQAYKKTGHKLNMGKSCVRLKHMSDLPTDLIAKTVAAFTPDQFIAKYKLDHA